jgi:site-specific DNA-methyltransferase (adenine-specific)
VTLHSRRACALETPRALFLNLYATHKQNVCPIAAYRAAARQSVHFSSGTCTPQALFDELSRIFGGFTLDPCASEQNAKCVKFFRASDDGLRQSWNGKVFMNPPYGREIGKWVKKAWDESLRGALVVCLLPARVDTRWWHDYASKGHVYFLKGRLKFGDARNSAPFRSAIVTFGKFFSR